MSPVSYRAVVVASVLKVAVMIFMCPMLSVLRSPRPHFLSPGICIRWLDVGWLVAEQLGSPGVQIRELIARTELEWCL